MTACPGCEGVFTLTLNVPPEYLEVNYAVTDGKDKWESNNGANYLLRMKQGAASLALDIEKEKDVIEEANRLAMDNGYAQEMARKNPGALFFTCPEKLVPGAKAKVYMDKMRSLAGLAESPVVNFVCGFNEWAIGNQTVPLKCNWNLDGIDWWTGEFEVPETAVEMNFSFSDGVEGADGIWDNNDDNDFNAQIKKVYMIPCVGGWKSE